MSYQDNLNKDGYFCLRNFFSSKETDWMLNHLVNRIQNVLPLEIRNCLKVIDGRVYIESSCQDSRVMSLFNNAFSKYYAGIFQRDPYIYRLATSKEIIDLCISLGLKKPILISDPLIMVNTSNKTMSGLCTNSPLHQDWASMQSSENSIVIWLPLTKIEGKEDGGISLYEGSHKLGLINSKKDEWFASINEKELSERGVKNKIYPILSLGDALVFSSLLVHQTSGAQATDRLRFTLQFRFSDESCKLHRLNNWNYNYNHCLPITSKPPAHVPQQV